jgi:hypothetical protein
MRRLSNAPSQSLWLRVLRYRKNLGGANGGGIHQTRKAKIMATLGRPRRNYIVALRAEAGASKLQKLGLRAQVVNYLNDQPHKRAHVDRLEDLYGRTHVRELVRKLRLERWVETLHDDET